MDIPRLTRSLRWKSAGTISGLLAGCLVGLAVAAAPLQPGPVGRGILERLAVAPNVRVLILLEPPAPTMGRESVRLDIAGKQDRVLSRLGSGAFSLRHRYQAIPALAGEITLAGIERLRTLPGVVRVDLDEGGHGHLAEAVPLTGSDSVQSMGFTGEGVTVAFLDSGIDTDHPDLGDDLVAEACFCSGGGGCCPNGMATQTGPGAAEDDHGHGTNVSGIVTSAGTIAPIGVAPDARIVAVKVLDSNNSFCCSSDVVAGLDWVITNRPDVDIVNMSLGTSALFAIECDNVTSFTMAFAAAINTLRSNGVVTFASSGNDGSGTQMTAPACVGSALSTGAVYDANVGSATVLGCTDVSTSADKVGCFSNSNSFTDLFAPGAPISSTGLAGTTSTFFGTSQASAHAAGCAADLLQAAPDLPPDALEAVLESSGVAITNPKNSLTFPRVDCFAALAGLPCVDVDADGFGLPGLPSCPGGTANDCDDADPLNFPGNLESCDNQDNDCDSVVDNGFDLDGDGFTICESPSGDCDDTSSVTHPGAPEVNDGADNQCPGDPGYGMTDEISGNTGFYDALDLSAYSWPVQEGANRYQIARSSSPEFSVGCSMFETRNTVLSDPDTPPGGVFYYLVRPLKPQAGSWGRSSTGIERVSVCGT